jgi:hypothetical protein
MEDNIGIKRLGLVIAKSYEIQQINDRMVFDITQLLYGCGINKNTSCALRGGVTRKPKRATLQRLSPLLFQVDHFKLVNDDDVGIPVLKFEVAYNDQKLIQLRTTQKVSDLPDLEYRMIGVSDIEDIINLKTPTKKVWVNASSLHRRRSHTLVIRYAV